MKAKLAIGERHLGGFMAQLKELTSSIAGAQQAARLLGAECATVVPEVPARLAADAGDLAAHLTGIATLAHKVAGIARSVQGKIAIVLGALQVGDSTRQRLEHVVSALQLADGQLIEGRADPAVAGHVDRLLAAQLDATMADFSRETAAMLASLADLVPDTFDLLDLIAEQGNGGTRSFLTRLDLDITDVERLTTRLREAESRATTMIGIIAKTIAELSERLFGVCRIQMDVQDIATNTRLLCGRHGHIGRAVSVIAAEVDAYAIRLGRPTASIARAIVELGAIEELARSSGAQEERDMGETLGNALTVVRRACQRTEQVSTEGSDDVRTLTDLLERTRQELAEELAVKGVMEAAAQSLRLRNPTIEATEAAEAFLRTLLPEIANLYTMASEREIHLSFLVPGMSLPTASAAIDDDDDDGLF
jgi:hypothetical protein